MVDLNRIENAWFSRCGFILAILIFLSCSVLPALVQCQPSSGDEPGPRASRFRTETERSKEELEKEDLKAPEIEIEKPEEKPSAPGPSFVLKELIITGATVFTPEEFRPLYEGYLEKGVTFADLEVIAKNIKEKYLQKGYATTIVYVPEQNVIEGKVELRVLEGRLGELKIEGNKWFFSSLIKSYIHAKKNEVLNLNALQKDLLRLNKNPDLEAKTVISQGKEPGTSDITLTVTERFPYHIGTAVDNQGSRLIGHYRGALSIRSTNLTGLNDSLFINNLATKSSFGNSVSYAVPFGTYGTKIGLDFTAYQMKLEKDYQPSDITGNTKILTPHISKEVYLSDNFQADIDMGIEIKSIKKKTSGDITTNDQLRLPYISLDFTKMDSFLGGGQTTFTPRFNLGFEDYLGASSYNHPSASRDSSGGVFGKYELTLRRFQRLPFESHLSLRAQFQDTSHTLPSSEQFQLGGAYSIRGYPEGDYTADRGGSLSLEWVLPMFLIPKDVKLSGMAAPLRHQINPVVFTDIGYGNLKKTLPGEASSKFLMGVGAGLRFNIHRNITLRFDWAEQVGDETTSGMGPSTFHMAFQCEI